MIQSWKIQWREEVEASRSERVEWITISDKLLISLTFSIGFANCNFPWATYTWNMDRLSEILNQM